MRRRTHLAGLATVAAIACAAPRTRAVGCDTNWGSDADVPFQVTTTGTVSEVRGRVFEIDGVRFERPTTRRQMHWCGDADWEEVYYEPVAVGMRVHVIGMLRSNGTTLAYQVGEYEADSGDPPDSTLASGVVQAVSARESSQDGEQRPVTCVVDGVPYAMDASWVDAFHDLDGPADDGFDVSFDGVAAGDTVLLTYTADATGARVVDDAFVRMSGSDSVLEGTVTDVLRPDKWNAEFEVDGVPVFWDGRTVAYSRDPQDVDPEEPYATLNFDEVLAGQTVRVTGSLRNGWFFADRLVIERQPVSSGAKRLARRAARLHVNGVIESGGAADAIRVSGLAVKLPARAARALNRPSPRPRRVHVDARIKRGEIVLARLRRN